MQPTLTSDTTQTPGLIALRDIAPTILQTESIAIPDSMSGHPAHVFLVGSTAFETRDRMLRRMDELTTVNSRALQPFGLIFGIGGGIVLFSAIGAVLRRSVRAASSLRFLLRMLLGLPLALVVAPLVFVDSPAIYLVEIGAIAAALGLVPRVGWLLGLTAVVLTVDAVCGAPMVSRSLLSGYWLSGIRFYGIGNEYMGVLIGAALFAQVALRSGVGRSEPLRPNDGGPDSSEPAIGADSSGAASLGRRGAGKAQVILTGIWFLTVTFVLAYPQFGAKAGGAVTAMAAFLPCWWSMRAGKSSGIGVWLVAVCCGFALIFGLSELAEHLGGRATHIQAATGALAHGRFDYIAHVALRKAQMAVEVTLAPATLAALAGFVAVVLIWRRSGLRSRLLAFLDDGHADLRRALAAGLWGMLAAVLFNDSGTVAAILLGAIMALTALHELLGKPAAAAEGAAPAQALAEL